MPSGRYFGFVIGGGLPAALAADWLTSAWDQNAGLYVGGPSASVVEQVVREWVCDLLGLPEDASLGLVTGTQMGSVTALAAARFRVLERVGLGRRRGRPLRSTARSRARRRTAPRHDRPCAPLARPRRARGRAADGQGRLDAEALRAALADGDGPTIVCAQAGEVNTGAFDPFDEIADAVAPHGAWLHVDGAFGLWAAASPNLRHLVHGVERAGFLDHGRPQVAERPLRLCARPLRRSGSASCGNDDQRVLSDPGRQPDRSRPGGLGPGVLTSRTRLRGVTPRCARSVAAASPSSSSEACACARRFCRRHRRASTASSSSTTSSSTRSLFRFESDARTDEVLKTVQEAGDVWMSGTTWNGRRAIRVSVSNWQTDDDEIDLALEAFRTASQSPAHAPAR